MTSLPLNCALQFHLDAGWLYFFFFPRRGTRSSANAPRARGIAFDASHRAPRRGGAPPPSGRIVFLLWHSLRRMCVNPALRHVLNNNERGIHYAKPRRLWGNRFASLCPVFGNLSPFVRSVILLSWKNGASLFLSFSFSFIRSPYMCVRSIYPRKSIAILEREK